MSSLDDDIVYKLRKQAKTHDALASLLKEAANEIQRLRESVEWLFKN